MFRVAAPALLAILAPQLALAQAPLPTTSPPSVFHDRIERLDHLLSDTAHDGGSFLMAYRNGDSVVMRGFGNLDCDGKVDMPRDALFDGGSLTKLFTTAAVFKLVEQGKLKLDDRLDDIFRGVPPDKRAITVAQLLAHRSGVPNFIGPGGRPVPERDWSIEAYDYAPLGKSELLARIWSAKLDFPPGTRDAYSNSGFTLLAAVVEAASREPYERYVRRSVFIPASMRNTGYLLLDRQTLAVTQQCRDGRAWGDPFNRGVWRNGVSWNLIGAGGMMTTLADLERFTAAIEDGALFRPDIRERLQQTIYGASARCRTYSAALGGSNGMTRSLILHLPRRREALVVVATHREHGLPEEGQMLAILCPTQ